MASVNNTRAVAVYISLSGDLRFLLIISVA